MTSELAPVGPPAGPQGRVSRIDGERLAMFRDLLAKGEPRERAWAIVCTDEQFGLLRFRGKPSIPAAYVRKSLARMLARVAPGELAAARDSVVETIARAAPKAAATIAGLVEKCDDPRGDTVRLAASKLTLETVGLGRGQPQAAAAPAEPVFSDGKGGFISVRALGERMRARANSYSDAPIQVQAEVRSVPDGTHNPRG